MTTINPYAVHVYEDGKHIGRLAPDGGIARLIMYAGMFSREAAERIAAEINAGENLTDDAGTGLSAKVREFSK